MRGAKALVRAGGVAIAVATAAAGCTPDFRTAELRMTDRARYLPYEPSPLPGGGGVALPLPAGTVARGVLPPDHPVATGMANGRVLDRIPIPVTERTLQRGQERFLIFCAPCHGRLGDGSGVVVQRGFPPPPDYAIRRLRDAPVGHFYRVITYGYGAMYRYADRVPPLDRWAIAAYIRLLQRVRPEVPPERFQELRERARREGIRQIGAPPLAPSPPRR